MQPTTYYLTLSQVFPASHPKAGEETGFKPKLFAALNNMPCYVKKLHTIRANYELWSKRFKKIERGEAILSIREWVGKPYGKGSTQREIARLSYEDGIGIERLKFVKSDNFMPYVNYKPVGVGNLANNDGLSINDWEEWFKGYDLSKPLAIIHFTNFRYRQ